jgi:hexokinase
MAHAFADPQTYVGIILGTGTNAAYVEKVENIPKWKGGNVPTGEMIINTEVYYKFALTHHLSGVLSMKNKLYCLLLRMIALWIKHHNIPANRSYHPRLNSS